VGHAYLDELDEEGGRAEVGRCLQRIEAETGARPRTFSYPAGRTSRRAHGWFEEAGVELAMTTITGTNRATDDRYALRRWDGGYLCVENRFVPSLMRLELSGALNWASRFRVYREGS
jgi:peptidoglycan/xylan/chitin deacetylase (PgdA/CDA1 family)